MRKVFIGLKKNSLLRTGNLPFSDLSGVNDMKYTKGEIVRFKAGSELLEGDVQFVERNANEDILYVNGFCGWAYKVPEGKVVSRVNRSIAVS